MISPAGVLISANRGWFLARLVNGEAVVYPLGNRPSGREWNLTGAGGVLIETFKTMLVVANAPASRADCMAP
jgi:hypothetical protein